MYLQTGLGTLFNALKLHESHYHSIGLHFRPVCQVSIEVLLFLEFNFSVHEIV